MSRIKRGKDLPSDVEEDVRFGTPQMVAEYRAERICGGVNTIIEVGAGAGFQTLEFAKRVDLVIAIDIDEKRLARANFPENVHVIAGDALSAKTIEEARQESKGRVIVFLDPKRPAKSRSRKIDEIEPNLYEFINKYKTITEDIAIELPPFLDELPFECEKEFISIDNQLNRLTTYMGSLKKSNISVVKLPEKITIKHTGDLPVKKSSEVQGKFTLLADRALNHAGLTALELPDKYEEVDLGNKKAYLSDTPGNEWFWTYKVIARGEDEIRESLIELDCQALIMHGGMTQEKQRQLLKELNSLCQGKRRLHLFISAEWILGDFIAQNA